jgi:predicted permease
VILNGRHYSVVGVAPASFHGLESILVSDFWVPLSMIDEILPGFTTPSGGTTDRRKNWLILDARLRPGVSRPQAAAAVNVVQQRLDATYRKDQKRHEAVTLNDAGGLPGASNFPAVTLMTVLMALAALVLMVACANAANLLLARATARHREMGVRLALGAGRGRLIRQLLTESLLLAVAGAGVGFLLAMSAARALSSFRLPLPLPVVFDFNVDLRVLEFTIGVSLVTTLLFGLAPALRSTRLELTRALKEGASGSTPREHSRMRKTLVVVQVSLSLVLLTTAGLFLRSLQKSVSIDVGFDTSNLLVLRVDPQLQNYPPEKTLQFLSQLRDRALALPGVRSVSYVDLLPLTLAASSYDFSVEAAGSQQAQRVSADLRRVFSGYFQTMGIPFLSGHDFDSNASQQGASVVIDKTTADRLFPNQAPIGRVVHSGKKSYTVIGVVRNANSRTAGERPMECAYLYLDGKSLNLHGTSVLIKTAVEPRQLERPVREQIAALDPNLAVFNTVTMQEQFTQALLVPRAMAWLLGCFGAVGLTLGTIGLYGVMSYSVHRRIHEIGVRMAMGARRGAVVGMILRQGLTLTAVGVIIGLAVAVVIGRLSAGLLYGVSGTDLITFLIVPTALTLVACAAIVIPAQRAAQVDPVVALRNE